jgi:cytochrome c553
MLVAICCAGVFSADASAHNVFKKQLQAKYPNMKISCNTCHVPKEKKSVRNGYGKLLIKMFDSKTLTADLKTKSGEEKKKFETEVMAPEFDKAFAKLQKMTFDDLAKAGVIDGITPKEEE